MVLRSLSFAALAILLAFGVTAEDFAYEDFSSISGLQLAGAATPSASVLLLNPSEMWIQGGVWRTVKVAVDEEFVTELEFSITELGAYPGFEIGADGLAVVFQNSGADVLGGCCIGYAGIPNSLAIELDTFWNGSDGWETNSNHLSVQTNGTGLNSEDHLFSIGAVNLVPDISDGLVHRMRIKYQSGELTIFVDDLTTPVLSTPVDLASILSLDSGTAWIGVVAGTGACFENHWLHSWWFSSLVREPTIQSITGPVEPQEVGTLVSTSAVFSDPDDGDVHTAIWSWGDGTTSPGVVVEPSVDEWGDKVDGIVTGSHTYIAPGVFTVTLTVDDGTVEGGAVSRDYQYIVVNDPDSGFVTGGGWIPSPPGAYPADPTLTGKANFGFVAKYHRGATVPTGTTEFRFNAANLDFRSSSYQWLVVAGAKAMFKGAGTVNGTTGYGFMISAIDGQLQGGGGQDKFRIRIREVATEEVVYDNQLDVPEDADPTTILGGGSIVIHK